MIETYLKEALIMTILASGLPLLVSSVVGLLVAVVQTATSIQEQSISYTLKLAAVVATIAVISPWLAGEFIQFTTQILDSLAYLGKS